MGDNSINMAKRPIVSEVPQFAVRKGLLEQGIDC